MLLAVFSVCDAATNFFFANALSCKRLTFSSGTAAGGGDGGFDTSTSVGFVGLVDVGTVPADLMAPNC